MTDCGGFLDDQQINRLGVPQLRAILKDRGVTFTEGNVNNLRRCLRRVQAALQHDASSNKQQNTHQETKYPFEPVSAQEDEPMIEHTLSWRFCFKDLKDQYPNESNVTSPKVTVGGHKWHISLFPNGELSEGNVSIYVQASCDTVHASCALRTSWGMKQKLSLRKDGWTVGWGWSEFCETSAIPTEEKVYIHADLKIYPKSEIIVQKLSMPRDPNPFAASKYLWTDKYQHDVDVLVGEERITAHKLILSAASPVFASIFDKQKGQFTTKGLQSAISINEGQHSAKTVKQLLEYVYTAKFPDAAEDVIPLLRIADMYQVASLCIHCINILSAMINPDSCIPLLLAVNRLTAGGENAKRAAAIRDSVMRYVGDNLFALSDKRDFAKLADDADLMTQVIKAKHRRGKKRGREVD